MFIGHFAVAYVLIALFPGIPPLVPLLGVSFPDLLWPVLVFLGLEKVEIDPATPRQDSIVFVSYPYSHSLLVGTLIAAVFGAVIGSFFGIVAAIVFVVASASHWVLDSVVHKRDLPLLGIGRFTTVGAGLWRYGTAAFVTEFLFYAGITLLAAPQGTLVSLLALGVVFHIINANSFFGFTKKNPFSTPRQYAVVCLIGFLAFIVLANLILSGWWNV